MIERYTTDIKVLDNNFYQNNDFLVFAFYVFVAMYYFLTVYFRKKFSSLRSSPTSKKEIASHSL